MSYYPIQSSYPQNFQTEIINKKEFSNTKKFGYKEPHQDFLKNFISPHTPYDSILLYNELGSGKCHAKDTLIIMFDGSMKMVQDLVVGDSIMGDDSTKRTITSLARGKDKMYNVIQENGNYIVNEEHILCLKEITSNDIYEISVKDYISLPKNLQKKLYGYRNTLHFSEKPIPFNPYFHGFLKNDNNNIVDISNIIYNSEKIRLNYLAGLIDAFGFYNGYICVSIKHNSQINYLIKSLGFSYFHDSKKNCYFIHGQNIHFIPTNIVKIPFLKRKNNLVSKIKISFLKVDNYYGFTLDGNCRYFMGNFSITHNTCTSISIAEGFKEEILKNGKKIVVISKNKNLHYNFKGELQSKCVNNSDYITNADKLKLKNGNEVQKEKVLNRINKNILKYYSFFTFGSLLNKVFGQTDSKGKRQENYYEKRSRINFSNSVIIIDEVHNITGNEYYYAIKKILDNSYNYRLVLLTGTPLRDNIKEIFEIANLLNKEAKLPIRNNLIKEKYIERYSSNDLPSILKGALFKITPLGENKLREALLGRVSWVNISQRFDDTTFPKRIDIGDSLINKPGTQKIVNCQMKNLQMIGYKKAYVSDISSFSENKEGALKEIEKDDKSSLLFNNVIMASAFVYPDGSFGKDGFIKYFKKEDSRYILNENYSPDFLLFDKDLKKSSIKIYKLLQNIQKPGIQFIYSNKVNFGGTVLLNIILRYNGYNIYGSKSTKPKFIVFDSKMSNQRRENLKTVLNSEKNANGEIIKIIVGSPVISEGITFKNIRGIHILDPSWNMYKIDQVIGRGIRNYSHIFLPLKDRNVNVYKYASIIPPGIDLFSTDLSQYILSEEKDRSNKKIERILKEESIDCFNSKVSNAEFEKLNAYSQKCDYTTCEIKCKGKKLVITNNDTYNFFINYFEKEKINWTINSITHLFKLNFIWSLKHIAKLFSNSVDTKIISYVIYMFVRDRILINDSFDREGYITLLFNSKNKQYYLLFNLLNASENNTIFEKYYSFKNIEVSENLENFILNYYPKLIEPKKEIKEKEKVEEIKLTEAQKQTNNKIMKSAIYGSFYKRNDEKDSIFRIIDNRNLSKNEIEDGRKILSGMACSSFNKKDLLEIAVFLKLNFDPKEQKIDKTFLCKSIHDELKRKNKILI